MPPHKQVTTCLRGGGPISKYCTCQHCTLGVCSVCGAYEGSLTTDCPGTKVDFDKQKEVYETALDYTDARGWHLGETMKHREPRFEVTHEPRVAFDHVPSRSVRIGGCSCGWSVPPGTADPEQAIAAHVAGTMLTPRTVTPDPRRHADLQHELTQRAIAWVLADRACEDQSAKLTHLEDEIRAHMTGREDPGEHGRALFAQLEHEKINFQKACHRVDERDDEFRQAARKIVDALEGAAEVPHAE